MKNYVQKGAVVTLAAPRALATSGLGVLVGDVFGFATASAESGDDVEVAVDGVFDGVKVGSQAWSVGDTIYWDNTNYYLTKTAAGNKRVGSAMVAVGSGAGETTGRVRIGGVASAVSVGGVGAGYRIARGGAAALDGSNPTPIATGLTTIVAAFAQLRGTSAPGDNTSVLTTDFSGSDGTLNVYAWKNTGGTDPTLVASTGTETFDWIAIGT